MARFRTVMAVLVALTLAFMPVASMAMAKSCAMTTAMTADNAADCPCHDSMLDCGTMPQCQTAGGCASQCFTFSCGVLPGLTGQLAPDRDASKTAASQQPPSLSIKPPAPPPRA
ncbi:MAG: hypothetical protein ACT4N2_09780 [Hyphomicrobium sp.]